MQFLNDWQLLIAAVLHWLAGGNPYGPYVDLLGVPKHAGAFAYPPPTLLLGLPVALLPWQVSGIALLLLSVAGFELWVRRSSGRSGLLWLVLWLPLCQGLWIGQTTLISLIALALAEQSMARRQERRSGLLIALAILKPQTVVLPAAWMLLQALRERRWRLLLSFGLLSLLLWGGVILVSGPQIYSAWLEGLRSYGPNLPNRPLLFPPFGALLGLLALLLWWRRGRGDSWGLLLLLNTLIYPLSVVYVAIGIAFVVVRWHKRWPWYPLLISWLIPALVIIERSPNTIAGLTQSIISTGLLAGLLPPLIERRGGLRRSRLEHKS